MVESSRYDDIVLREPEEDYYETCDDCGKVLDMDELEDAENTDEYFCKECKQ